MAKKYFVDFFTWNTAAVYDSRMCAAHTNAYLQEKATRIRNWVKCISMCGKVSIYLFISTAASFSIVLFYSFVFGKLQMRHIKWENASKQCIIWCPLESTATVVPCEEKVTKSWWTIDLFGYRNRLKTDCKTADNRLVPWSKLIKSGCSVTLFQTYKKMWASGAQSKSIVLSTCLSTNFMSQGCASINYHISTTFYSVFHFWKIHFVHHIYHDECKSMGNKNLSSNLYCQTCKLPLN